MHRIFLLSPASCRGRRTEMLLRREADFPLARALRAPAGVELGDVFTFLSGLYFRGKLAYARAYARPPVDTSGVYVITSTRGLLPPEAVVVADDLREFAEGEVRADAPSYRRPLEHSAVRLVERLPPGGEVVLLGSIATNKYLAALSTVFDRRLCFPRDFIGRGDMSRGGLLLRAVEAGRELEYVGALDAPRRGARPPRLSPRAAPAPNAGEAE